MIRSHTARAAVVGAALCMLVVAGSSPLRAAGPLIPPSQMLTVDQIRPGAKGVGKSVFRGTEVESFGVTVIGVLRGVDFDKDIILVRIDSGPPVSRGYGVVAGMSGSPIYVDGKLIGALAYAWPFAKDPIAGVTPIAEMLESYQPGTSAVRPQGSLTAAEPFLVDGERIERAVVAPSRSEAAAARGPNSAVLVPVATPVLVSGLEPGALSFLRAALEPLGLLPLAGAGAMGSVETHVVPGQAVGARLVGGDLDVTAIGTVTLVKDGVVLAFGHPLSSLGSADIPLVAAHVHGVMPSAELSFKLASSGQALGRFTEDRPGCVGGVLGGAAELIGTTLEIADQDRRVTRHYSVEVIRNRILTPSLLSAVLASAIRSVGPPSEGTSRVRFSIDAEGLPHMERENTYAMDSGLGVLALLLGSAGGVGSATEELSQILDVLQDSEFGEAPLRALSIAVELSKQRKVARLEHVYVPTPRVKPGDEVRVVIALRTANGGRITRTETMQIPATCPPGSVRLGVAGGRVAESLRSRLAISEPRPESLSQMIEQMLDRPGNNDLVLALALPTVGIGARGHVFHDLPPAMIDVLQSATATRLRPLRDYVQQRSPTEWVVSGQMVLSLVVEGEEKDKAGRPPSPRYRSPMYEEVRPGLADFFSGLDARTSLHSLAEDRGMGEDEEEIDIDAPPPMPTWEEVEQVGEVRVTAPSFSEERGDRTAPRGDAIGRLASVWHLATQKELAKGKTEGVALLSTGGLTLAPKARVLTQIDAQCLSAIAVAADGSVYSGSWVDGCLRRTNPEGDTEVILRTEDAAVQAVAVAPDGSVLAAAIPSSTIYSIGAAGEARELCQLDAEVVWALAPSSSGVVWAATGPQGKLYRISPDGDSSVVFTAADRHITALAFDPEGTLYLATSPLGKVYAVDPEGAVRAVCEIEKAAVQSIGADGEGTIYVGTSPDARVLQITRDGAVRELLKAKARHMLALLVAADGRIYAAGGPDAKVYLIRPDEYVAEIYDPKTSFVAAMAAGPGGDIHLSAADTGRLIKLEPAAPTSGRYLSPVHDAGAAAHWGAVRWRAQSPADGDISIWTRTGATGHPDDTWSPWQPVGAQVGASVASPAGRFLQCRIGLTGTASAPPMLDGVAISYLPANRPPEVTISEPRAGEIWSGEKTIRWSGKDPDKDKLTFEIYWSSDRGESWTRIPAPGKAEEKAAEEDADGTGEAPEEAHGEEAEPADAPRAGGRTAAPRKTQARGVNPQSGLPSYPATSVSSEEADLEEVQFEDAMGVGEEAEELVDGEAEPEAEEAERPSGRPLASTSRKWDTAIVSDGTYWIRVMASDGNANPADPREAESISKPFVVDNTPPELIADRRRSDEDPPPSQITVFEATTYITSAEFRADGGEWLAAVAGDGIFDGQYEAIVLDEARLPEGAHAIEVRVRDAAGNAASGTLRYSR